MLPNVFWNRSKLAAATALQANVSKIVAAFPSVVLDDFEKAMHELEKLAVAYEPREFCHIVDTAPIILLEDLDVIIPDMQR